MRWLANKGESIVLDRYTGHPNYRTGHIRAAKSRQFPETEGVDHVASAALIEFQPRGIVEIEHHDVDDAVVQLAGAEIGRLCMARNFCGSTGCLE